MVDPTLDEQALTRRSGMTSQDLDVAARPALFSELPRSALMTVLADSMVREVGRGTVLFLQGDPCDRFYIVLRGWVRLFRQAADGTEITISLMATGESLAEAAMFADGRFPVSGVAADDSRLLMVPKGPFLRQMEDDPRLCRSLMASMSMRLHAFVRQIEQISYRSTVERLAGFLLRMCEATSGGCRITLPMDKALVAARLNMQPETLSRGFAKLRAHGVETHGSEVLIADIGALRALVQDDGDED
ncbi:MAG: Crp/Fnr family transcriptional regulator [Geminicoccaceae bacterium]